MWHDFKRAGHDERSRGIVREIAADTGEAGATHCRH
jgi:hypothetical protein